MILPGDVSLWTRSRQLQLEKRRRKMMSMLEKSVHWTLWRPLSCGVSVRTHMTQWPYAHIIKKFLFIWEDQRGLKSPTMWWISQKMKPFCSMICLKHKFKRTHMNLIWMGVFPNWYVIHEQYIYTLKHRYWSKLNASDDFLPSFDTLSCSISMRRRTWQGSRESRSHWGWRSRWRVPSCLQ